MAVLLFCPAARELVREVDYTLKTLSKNLLGQDRSEVPSTGDPTACKAAWRPAQDLSNNLFDSGNTVSDALHACSATAPYFMHSR